MADSCDVQNVNDPLHRNWLKAVRALKVLKCGVEDFIDTHTKKYHEQLKSDARKLIISGKLENCSQCLVKHILPWHVHAKSNCPYREFRHLKCLCVQDMRGKRLCSSPGSPCSVLFDLIVAGHFSRNPIFSSTDCSQWASDYWSICLCYLSTQCYSRSSCASDLDAASLLSVMINCKFLHNYIDDIAPLQRVRKSRNEILHSATYQLSDTKMRDIIQSMICILKDKRHLLKDPKAQLATQQLIELINDEGIITLEEAKELEQIAINSIEMTKENAIETLTEHTDIQLQKIQKKHDEFFEKTKADSTVSQDVLDDLQQYLIDTYRQYYVKVDVTPLLPEEDDDIEHLYVPLRMEKIVRTEKTYQNNLGHDLHQKVHRNNETVQQIDTFEEMLTLGGDCKKNIFVIADAGMGKTTLCRKITSSWCFSHVNLLSKRCSVKESSNQLRRSNKTESKFVRQASAKNMLYMQRFRFMFYVSLRHAAEERSIEKMIEAQLLEDSHIQTFRWIVKTMPEQCLYIVDGLDEWRMQTKDPISPKTPSGIPRKENRCTAIFTSRPWKMTEILPRPSDIDIEIRLKGMTTETIKVLSSNVLDRLNESKGKSLKVVDFQHEIEQRKLQSLLTVPLMLKLLLCSWFNNHKLHETKTEIYVDVVQLMLKIFRDQKEHQCITRQISEPSDNDLDRLPLVLRQKEEYIQFARMIIGLAKFSYTSFIQSDSLVFKTTKLTHCGMKQLDVELCLKAGLLSQTTIKTQSVVDHTVQISYVHRTFQEFFAAIHLNIHPDMLSTVLRKCTNRHSLGKLARILQFTSGFSSEAVKTISEISEYVSLRNEIERDDETCRLVQDTVLGCLSEAKQKPEETCISIKVLQLSIESDMNLIPYIRPETVRQLVITHHVTCQSDHISCITLMTGLTQLLIMNHNDTINAHALLSIVHGCNNLKKLELDEYDLTPFREKSLHSCMCNVTYIRLFGCTLSHTQVTNLLCEAPKLADITLWAVRCVADDKCGCQDKDKQFHGEKQIGENDLQTLEENERYCRHGQVTVTTCHIYDSSQVFVHVLQSDSLTTLLIDEYEFSDDTGLEMFIPRCNKLQNLELDNIILDTRNIITIIKNAKPGAELQVKLNKTQVLGGDASHLENALDALPFVDLASFTANDNEIIRASIIVSKPREVRGVDMNNDDQSSDDEERPLLDQHIDVLDSSDVCFEMMTMSERKMNNTSCCECTLL